MRVRKFLVMIAGLLLPAAAVSEPLAQSYKVPGTKSGYVSSFDGTKIHYLEAGKPGRIEKLANPPTSVHPFDVVDAPAILFVPGWTMPAWIWEQQIAHFAKTHRVVAMDPRAQGKSSQTTEGHYPGARARDIKAVVDQLKLAPVVLVGWSMGVTEAVAYVDQFGTDTLAGLVLVDGWAGFDYDPKLTPQLWQWAAGFQKERRKQTEAFVRSMFKRPQTEEHLKRLMEASLVTPTNSAMALFVGAFTSDFRPTLAKINKPTLLVVAQSPWVPFYQDMQKRTPGARMEVLENVGHALFVDDAARFNSLLDDFLKSLPSPRRTR